MSDQSKYKSSKNRLREAGAHRVHELCESGMTYQQVAAELGVSMGTVYNIKNGITWGFVKAEREAAKKVV